MSNTSLLGSYGAQDNSSLLFRNKVINGDMRIDQRNSGAAVTLLVSENKHSADRWYVENATDGVASIRQVTTISGAVNFEANSAPDGFTHSIKWTVTTADATIGNAQSAFIQQRIEGLNCSDLGFGTASAKPITVSFWVKATATGTFGGSIANNTYNRCYAFSFTINSANTWEQKTVTIPGDTAGTWLYDNGVGLRLSIALAAGTDRSATPGSWVSSVAVGATGQTNFMASAVGSPSFYLSGVQLEAGPTATPFERRPYSVELGMCQRYYEKIPYGAHFVTARSNGGNPTVAVSLPQVLDKRTTAPSIQVAGGLVDLADLSNRTISAQTQVYGDGYVVLNISSAITGNIAVSCYLNTIQINAEL